MYIAKCTDGCRNVVHCCTKFLCSLDVGNIIDDQCRGPSIKGKDHLDHLDQLVWRWGWRDFYLDIDNFPVRPLPQVLEKDSLNVPISSKQAGFWWKSGSIGREDRGHNWSNKITDTAPISQWYKLASFIRAERWVGKWENRSHFWNQVSRAFLTKKLS